MAPLVEHLADQLRRAAEGDAWHGPSLREALDGIDAVEASQRPIPSAHTIWELVVHLRGTYALVLRRLGGSDAPLLPIEDWPPVATPSEEHWQRDIASLFALDRQLQEAVLRFPVERLFEPLVANPPYSAITQFIGVTQHNLYHVGQIILLRRALKHHDHPT